MKFNRRQLLGALSIGASGLVSPRAFAAVQSSAMPRLLPQAMAALDLHHSKITKRDVVGIVDFSDHCSKARLHFVDIANGRVEASWLVSHGRGSDPSNSGWLERFSNRPGSNASCAGSFLIGDGYTGKHGRSRRLMGLDPQNSNALSRAIVMHGAGYVSRDMARRQGRIGRSLGCFAVARGEIDEVLRRLEPGLLLFAAK